ncbi:MAG: hypothetical protein KUG67_02835 [Proteobacteria bacterium]|nr:hypothetical protein [Pseudomonadota bacterium]
MGSFSKQKGKRGEREVVKLLQPIVDKVFSARGLEVPILYRNQNQSFQGGYDIDGIDWIALEVKRQETLHINKWWDQTVSQAGREQVPVLIYRKSRMKWRVIMYGYLDCGGVRVKARVDIELEAFLVYFETRMVEVIEGRLE